jgi:hypothetical protein
LPLSHNSRWNDPVSLAEAVILTAVVLVDPAAGLLIVMLPAKAGRHNNTNGSKQTSLLCESK